MTSAAAYTIVFDQALLPTGWARHVAVTVQDGVITAVVPDTLRAPHMRCIDGITVPGLVNVHSHAFQRAMAGRTEVRGPAGDNFWTWREDMYRCLDSMGPDEIYAISRRAFAEMKAAGFSRVCEFHYVHNAPDGRAYDQPHLLAEQIIAAAVDADIALTLLPVFYAHSDFGGLPPKPGQRRFIQSLDRYADLLAHCRSFMGRVPGLMVGVAPHSLRAVTPDELSAVVDLAGDGPIHIHVSEQEREVEACLAWSGQRPVAWLFDHLPVDARWCLIHATHVDAGECQQMARAGVVAGLCPVTEANLGDGIFPLVDYLQAGGRFAVGTDSNVRISVPEELRLLEYVQRLVHRQRNVLAMAEGQSVGATIYRAAVAGGAQASGVTCGQIAVGHRAEWLTLNASDPRLAGLEGDQKLDGWIFG